MQNYVATKKTKGLAIHNYTHRLIEILHTAPLTHSWSATFEPLQPPITHNTPETQGDAFHLKSPKFRRNL